MIFRFDLLYSRRIQLGSLKMRLSPAWVDLKYRIRSRKIPGRIDLLYMSSSGTFGNEIIFANFFWQIKAIQAEARYGIHDRLSPDSFSHRRHINLPKAQVVELHRRYLPDPYGDYRVGPLKIGSRQSDLETKQFPLSEGETFTSTGR